jgi:blue copper oxidase
MIMKRRDFVKLGVLSGLVGGLPLWSPRAWAVEYPALPVPPLLVPDTQGHINLTIQSGKTQFRAANPTVTWGYNGSLLGPALRFKRGDNITLSVKNQLTDATTVHLHGLEIPGDVDGGPHAIIQPGESLKTQFLVDQPASTCWFHPHPHHVTGYQVAKGLGGLILIEDRESSTLTLPKNWGVDDIPLILQDKKLNGEGQIDYKLDLVSGALGWAGDFMITNGVIYPQHIVPRGWLRLRFLNACNARSLNLTTSDKRPMYVIASDGGYLSEPTKVDELLMLTAERFEVLIDTSDGKSFDIVTLPVHQRGMTAAPFDGIVPVLHIETTLAKGVVILPDRLVTLPAIPSTKNITQRRLQLSMYPELENMEDYKGVDILKYNFINGQAFDMMKPMFNVKKGVYEKWSISAESDMMLHPFHIHGTQFRILSENGKPPAAHRSGWKDIVNVQGAASEVLVKFEHLAPRERAYMAHCHILEHEDTGMMTSFTVTE